MSKLKYPSGGYDLRLLFPALFLTGIGIVMVYSASSAIALKKFGDGYFFLKRQGMFALGGILAMIAARHFPLRLLHSLTYPLLVISGILLILVLIPGMGVSAGGATRWMRIGKLSFQPSEFARFSMIVYMAYSMSKKKEKLREFYVGFLPHILILGTLTLLILKEPDFGASLILCTVTWIMMFVGGVPVLYLGSTLLLFAPVGYLFLASAEYRMRRLSAFLDPWQHSGTEGYQIIHSLMAFGSGGIFGKGIGNGYQKLFYLPEPHTDFIFSVIGEEMGLLGVALIIGLYVLIVVRGIQIAMEVEDRFASYLAIGLTTAFGLQVCVNMGVALSLLPTKGLTLPFLSYGGTSLMLNMTAIGVLMNIKTHQPELREPS